MENNTDNTGMTWEVVPYIYDGDGDPNEIVELTVSLPKISTEKQKAIEDLRQQQIDFESTLSAKINNVVNQYTKELHQKYPEMQGQSLEQLGIMPVLKFKDGGFIIEIEIP